MNRSKLRIFLVTAVASLSLGATVAHAQPAGGGSGGSGGAGCAGPAERDGDTVKYTTKYERGTYTCTNGTSCHTWGVLDFKGHRIWYSECTEAAGLVTAAPPAGAVTAPSVPRAALLTR